LLSPHPSIPPQNCQPVACSMAEVDEGEIVQVYEEKDPLIDLYFQKEEEMKAAEAELKKLKQEGDKTKIAEQLIVVADILMTMPGTPKDQKRNMADAASNGDEAAQLYAQLGNKAKQAELLLYVTQIHMTEEEFGMAIKSATEAVSIYKQLGDNVKTADALCAVASGYTSKMIYSDAIDKMEEAKALYKEAGDNPQYAGAMIGTAQLRLHNQEPLIALEDANEALKLSKSIPDEQGQASALKLVAEATFAQLQKEAAAEGDSEDVSTAQDPGYKECIKTCKEAMRLFIKLKDEQGRAACLALQASIHIALRQGGAAVEAAAKSKRIWEELENTPGYLNALMIHAQANLQAGDSAMAMRSANEALEICYVQGDQNSMRQVQDFIGFVKELIYESKKNKGTGRALGLSVMVFKM